MRFEAEVVRVQTRASDNTVNVTFNLPEYQLQQAQLLMGLIGDMVSIDCSLLAAADGKQWTADES